MKFFRTTSVPAFTLIELLVVIVIVGILSAVGVAQFSSYFGKASDAKVQAELAQMYRLLMADGVSDNLKSFEIDSSVGRENTVTAIIEKLYKRGMSLPDPSKGCYILLISTRLNNEVVPADERKFAIISAKRGKTRSDGYYVGHTANVDDFTIMMGHPDLMDIFRNNKRADNSDSWAVGFNIYQDSYTRNGGNCSKPTGQWNGLAITPSPYEHLFGVAPLDPSLAP